jgi:hypothetical protein
MSYSEDDNVDNVCPKDDVEGKPAKDGPAKVSIESLIAVG